MAIPDSKLWNLSSEVRSLNLGGFTVKTLDGVLGKAVETKEAGDLGYLVLKSDPGQTLFLPGGFLELGNVDLAKKTVTVDHTSDELLKFVATDVGESSAGRVRQAGDSPLFPFSA